nr:MAG TPA: hypothetical protein [Caudoviricetes sp.]
MRAFFSLSHYLYINKEKYMNKKLELLITIALVLCALFCLLTFFNVSWFVVLFASHCLETIIGLILGFAVAILIYDNEDNDEKR